MTNFWQTWLRFWCLFVCLFGAVLAGATFDSTGALVIWFLLDGIASLVAGFELNVLSNTIILAWFVLPLWNSGLLAID